MGLDCQRALQDGIPVDAGGQRAEDAAAGLAEAAGAERVGHGGRRVADEQRGLEGEREVLDAAAGGPLVGRRRERVEVRVEQRVAAAGELALGQEGGQALGLAGQRAQDVEASSRCPSPPRCR